MDKCENCIHRTDEEIYDYKHCIRCSHNPFAISDRYKAKIPEIRPKEAGEVWSYRSHEKFMTFLKGNSETLWARNITLGTEHVLDGVVHNRDHWTRERPPVEDEREEIVAWLHTMDNTDGIPENKPMKTVTFDPKHPWGVPGRDYSKEYIVTSEPLYIHPPVEDGERVEIDNIKWVIEKPTRQIVPEGSYLELQTLVGKSGKLVFIPNK